MNSAYRAAVCTRRRPQEISVVTTNASTKPSRPILAPVRENQSWLSSSARASTRWAMLRPSIRKMVKYHPAARTTG